MSRKRARKPATSPSPAPIVPTAAAPPTRGPDVRRWIYAGLDALLALVYLAAVITVAHSRLAEGRVVLASLPALAACAAAGMSVGGAWGWRVACLACGGLCAVAAWLLLALCVDAAFLTGVYGSFGKAAASFALITGLLVIELVALVPALQLKWLRGRAGRRAFGVPPPVRA